MLSIFPIATWRRVSMASLIPANPRGPSNRQSRPQSALIRAVANAGRRRRASRCDTVCAKALASSSAVMSSFIDVKLDNIAGKADNSFMKATQQQTLHPRNVTSTIRQRIEASGERVWRMTDFSGLSFPAVAQALSRLARQGQLRRLGKGLATDHGRQPWAEACPTRPSFAPCPSGNVRFSRSASQPPICSVSPPRTRPGLNWPRMG